LHFKPVVCFHVKEFKPELDQKKTEGKKFHCDERLLETDQQRSIQFLIINPTKRVKRRLLG